MIKFKEIQLYPSLFTLDVFVTKDLKALQKVFFKRYGLKEIDFEGTKINEVSIIDSGKKSFIKCETRIVMIIGTIKDHGTIVHEISHVLDDLNRLMNIELGESSTEWKASFLEYVFTNIIKNNYKIL